MPFPKHGQSAGSFTWPGRNWLRFWTIPSSLILLVLGTVEGRSQANCAQDPNSEGCELLLPLVCSRDPSSSTAAANVCEVTSPPQGGSSKRVQVNLTARTATVNVGGYNIETENYNGAYLAPVIEALPGDQVAARLQNTLSPRQSPGAHAGHGHDANDNPTNLHFFHGGIVTPRNARRQNDPNDDAALLGNGDNVFVYLKSGTLPLNYEVPIPTNLDAGVLEQTGVISHPSGLNWYHSHLHGLSSDQVMGGLSGLLSVGEAKANVIACKITANPQGCILDPAGTMALKARTDVRYAMLRDISVKETSALPNETAAKTATWAPEDRDWPASNGTCGVWTTPNSPMESDPKLRKGYCQRTEETAWLFTLNGQRFPTITVEGGRNLLLRLGNLSPNVTYWLELYNKDDETDKLPLRLLSIDGVVPAAVAAGGAGPGPATPAVPVNDLVFLPASRAEIYVRNDCRREQDKVYVLRTKALSAGTSSSDSWPEIQLAQIKLKASAVSCAEEIALNRATSRAAMKTMAKAKSFSAVTKPEGCVDDIDPAKREHRRVIFQPNGKTSDGRQTDWSILTEIRRPPDAAATAAPRPYSDFLFDPDKTVGIPDSDPNIAPDGFRGVPFEEYDLGGGKVAWHKPHACVRTPSSKQLWVLENQTGALHNFHIHQMKFRLATAAELIETYKIDLTNEPAQTAQTATRPSYKRYETGPIDERTRWHDTIPMPHVSKVYVIMSFVAEEQIGRYVYHCHILKHEDSGLMAPIEVWRP